MDDFFEKKLKEFLPYIIIIAVVYLFVPAIVSLTQENGQISPFAYVTYMGILPLTAFFCNFVFAYKNQKDFLLSLVAPIIFIPSMLLYGNLRDSVVNSIIYLISYFICAYLGLEIGDMVSGSNKQKPKSKSDAADQHTATAHQRKRHTSRQKKRVPKHVKTTPNDNVDLSIDYIRPVEKFEDSTNPISEQNDYSAETDDDINAILDEIRNRH